MNINNIDWIVHYIRLKTSPLSYEPSPMSIKYGWFRITFWHEITPQDNFHLNRWFLNIFSFFFRDFVVLMWRCFAFPSLFARDFVFMSCYGVVWLKLSYQLRSNAHSINYSCVVNLIDPMPFVLYTYEYSHICRLTYFVVLCYYIDVMSLSLYVLSILYYFWSHTTFWSQL